MVSNGLRPSRPKDRSDCRVCANSNTLLICINRYVGLFEALASCLSEEEGESI